MLLTITQLSRCQMQSCMVQLLVYNQGGVHQHGIRLGTARQPGTVCDTWQLLEGGLQQQRLCVLLHSMAMIASVFPACMTMSGNLTDVQLQMFTVVIGSSVELR